MLAAFEDSDFEKMEEIRARVDAIVEDPATAQALKAWYRQLCKRPCFHDEYLQAFNEPGVHLVDTDGQGVERITENGVVVGGREYEVDCIIYASGFEVGTEYKRRAGFDLTGRDGLKLSEAWADGHALQARHPRARLPERLLRAAHPGRQPDLQRAAQPDRGGQTIAGDRPPRARPGGHREVEVTQEAQDAWVALLLTGMGRMMAARPTAPPATTTTRASGRAAPRILNVGYPAGASAYFEYIDDWRNSGTFEGLGFR